ncbi:SfnB family sulfur acquisition oxidoreductase [Aureimonas sp. ME7]|uniref:SfnB family sulfur acquisition oxidoreductase n=1 Tax=Aureimonas sp. ME7 TaxID=2744252 RepID=UPI0015F77B30|nr:SfnB family sulfur acquisition oxidoreductase [Aureimonas sp. ME7]
MSPAPAHVIRDDADALAAASRLAEGAVIGAAERDRNRVFPRVELDRWSSSGLGGITVPREFRGADVSFATLAEVFATVSAADPSLGQIPQNQVGVLAVISEIGTAEQKRRFFADALAGLRFGNAGPERTGQRMTDMTTRVVAGADGLRLNGQRFYSTGALFAHWIPTRALGTDDRPVFVFARRDAPGVNVVDDWSAFGQRTTASGTVTFDNVAVTPDDMLPLHAMADRPTLAGPVSQLVQAAIDLGIARAAVADAVAYVRDQGRPWIDSGVDRASDDPTIRHGIGHLSTALAAAEAVTRESAETLDAIAAEPVTPESSARASVAVAEAKILTTEIALEAAETLFDLAGAGATRGTHALDRHWRNARVHTLHDPVRWKYHLLGNYAVNGTFPRRHSWN